MAVTRLILGVQFASVFLAATFSTRPLWYVHVNSLCECSEGMMHATEYEQLPDVSAWCDDCAQLTLIPEVSGPYA